MVDISTIPRVPDDTDTIARAILTFNEVDQLLTAQMAQYLSAGEKVSADWVGQSAEAFIRQHEAGRQALGQISRSHRDFSGLLGEYHAAVVHAQGESARAQAHAQQALQNYQSQANQATNHLADAVDDVVSGILEGIQNAIESGINFVRENVFHQQVSRGRAVAAESRAWSPPHVRVSLIDAHGHEIAIPSFGDVQRGVVAVGGTVTKSIIDGVQEFIHLGGAAVGKVVELIHDLERALVHALETAWRWACEAIQAVVRLAKRIGQAIRSAVIETLRVAWQILQAAGHAIGAAIDVAIKVITWIECLDDVVLWGIVAAVSARIYDQPRRAGSDARDLAAATAFAHSQAIQRAADDRRSLCASSYDDEGAPKGWERVKNEVGPDGGFAVIYRNLATGEIVIAFRGSEPADGRDWHEDAMNAANLATPQGVWAAQLAADIQQHPGQHGVKPGAQVSFTGHSLGGSLAAIASISTGLEATTFNAAGIGDGNYAAAMEASGGAGNESGIVNYSTTHDILTNGQEVAGVRPAAGDQVLVRTRDGIGTDAGGMIQAHGLDAYDWPPGGMAESNPDYVYSGPTF